MNRNQYQKISPNSLATFFVNKYNGQYFLSSDCLTNDAKKKLMAINLQNQVKIANAINEAIINKFKVNENQTILLSKIHHVKTKHYLQYFANVQIYENKCHTDFLISHGTYTCFIF